MGSIVETATFNQVGCVQEWKIPAPMHKIHTEGVVIALCPRVLYEDISQVTAVSVDAVQAFRSANSYNWGTPFVTARSSSAIDFHYYATQWMFKFPTRLLLSSRRR
jgi:hypothetical protein